MTKKEIVIESLYIYQRLSDKRRNEIVQSITGKNYMETKLSIKKFEELYNKLSQEMRVSGLYQEPDNRIFFQGSNINFYLDRL